ncbi:MAG: hypothetical protein P8X84_02170 [Candidatus Bathyarchaeota archaeon]
MRQQKLHKNKATILLLLLLILTTSTIIEVRAKTYAFTATVTPTQVNVNQLATYLITINNTGESTLGSTTISTPAGLTVLAPITILNPTSLWNYVLTNSSIILTATTGGGVLNPGENLVFTFEAIAPTLACVLNWTIDATTSIEEGGVALTLNSEQPTITVNSLAFTPPTISASTNKINQDQSSLLSQTSAPSGGTPPYTFQWLKSYEGETFTPILGGNQPDYTFTPTTTTPIGTWQFKLEVTDNSSSTQTTTSNTINIRVNPTLIAPTTSANPNQVPQNQSSILSCPEITTGTSPYTFQWYQKEPGQNFTPVGSNSTTYTFLGSTITGAWTFIVQITDNTGSTVNSTETEVNITPTAASTITVIQTSHGTITPETCNIIQGGYKVFNINPEVGYYVSDVLVDGISVGTQTSYNFTNVVTNHNLTATFATNQSTISLSISSNPGGEISPTGTLLIPYGTSQTFTITPNTGYKIADVLVNGSSIGASSSFNLHYLTGNTAIKADFEPKTLTITVQDTEHGSITPSGTIQVNYGHTQSFTFNPEDDYFVSDILVDGNPVGSTASYSFSNVTSNHTLSAIFSIKTTTYYIDVISSQGQATPSSEVNVGDDFIVSAKNPKSQEDKRWICTGYTLDDGPVISGKQLTLTNIQSNHIVTFVWEKQYYLFVNSKFGQTSGAGWYNVGTTVSVSVNDNILMSRNDKRELFTGWTGDATGKGTTSNTIVMDGPKTVVANWKTQYEVTYNTVSDGVQETNDITEWVDMGTPVKGNFKKIKVNAAGNVRHVLVSETASENVDRALTLTGVYQTQYLVSFGHDGIDQEILGTIEITTKGNRTIEELPISIWVNAGDTITFSYPKIIKTTKGEKQYILKEGNASSTLTINEPLTLHGYYVPESMSAGFGPELIVFAVLSLVIPASIAIPIVVRKRKDGSKIIKPRVTNGGIISPNTKQKINFGEDSTVFIVAADQGYKIEDVVIDKNIHLGAIRTYKFENVTKNHTISAIFKKN